MSARHLNDLDNGWTSYPVREWLRERPLDHVADLRFWLECAEEFGSPVLDVACGCGRIAVPLAYRGYDTVGVDVNQDFIAAARQYAERTAPQRPAALHFENQDIRSLDLGRQFRLAVMADWSFQVLLTREAQESFLERLHAHLLPQGAFAFNLFAPESRRLRGSRDYDPQTRIETVGQGRSRIRLRHTSLEELRELLTRSGFRLRDLFGDVDRRPFEGKCDDDHTVVAVREDR
jgi:SAM-dependent methyltransferase